MIIIPKTKVHARGISELMLKDLQRPDPTFPAAMLQGFIDHAKEENIYKELDNPDLLSFVSIRDNKVIGFIVGYRENSATAMIHYITGDDANAEKCLLERFITECKNQGICHVKADTFEFRKNKRLLEEKGFVFTKKERITDGLDMLWYELSIFTGISLW